MRVLIVEDEDDLAKALQRQGYAVDIALDGPTGWELMCVHAYDLLILDLNLPGYGPRTMDDRPQNLDVLALKHGRWTNLQSLRLCPSASLR